MKYHLCVLISIILIACGCIMPVDAATARSIRDWVKGDGQADDAVGVARAFDACKNNAFELLVDSPVFIHVGRDISRPIFVDNGTHVRFTKNGLFITDDVLQPAFVIANSTDVQFVNWRVQYVGGIPIDRTVGGYYNNGVLVGQSYPSAAFNDLALTPWLKAHRGIEFGDAGAKNCPWHGPTNMSSLFYLIGSTNHVDIENMTLFVPPDAKGSQFIPMAFSMTSGYNNNVVPVASADNDSWTSVPNISVPRDLTFKNITLDGYYMGFQGTFQHSTITNVIGLRYGDLQDADGNNIGGVGKWFAPPHLFYCNGDRAHPYDSRLACRDLAISNVRDIGPRIGKARDTVALNRSGYANSLKIGAVDSTVTNYTSNRPDGLADILSCDKMTLTNIKGTYDSSFINDLYPGIRFPSGDYYQYLTLKDVTLTDTAPDPYGNRPDDGTLPISGFNGQHNSNVLFENVVVNLTKWNRPNVQPTYSGQSNVTPIKFNIGH